MQFKNGALIFGRLANLEISIDWSWLLLIYLRMQSGVRHEYKNPAWIGIEIITFILIVLMIDIAQIIACRFVGGRVTQLRLSFLSRGTDLTPPHRPTAILLTHLAGVVVWCFALTSSFVSFKLYDGRIFIQYIGFSNDFNNFLFFQMIMCAFLTAYNAAPAFPNDGGQVLRSLLWFVLGPAWSLRIACGIGLLIVAGMLALAVRWQSYWMGIIAAMLGWSCIQGFRYASLLAQIQKLPRRDDFHCPKCGSRPPEASRQQTCPQGHVFDLFACHGVCPQCGAAYETVVCVDCQVPSPPRTWSGPIGAFPLSGDVAAQPNTVQSLLDAEAAKAKKKPPEPPPEHV